MKKYFTVFLCLVLTGCAQPAPAENPLQETEPDMNISDSMNIILSREYGNFMVKWTSPSGGNSDLVFDVEVLAEDPDYEPECPVKIRTYASYADALSMVGYFVQENNYDGSLYFRITAYQDSEAVLSEDSEMFASSSVIPDKKELVIGTDLKTDGIYSFSYSGNGDSAELNFSYGVNVDDDRIIYTADFHVLKGKDHSIEKEISADEWNALLTEISKGSMRLKHFMDPDLIMLDGSRQWFTLLFADMDPAWERLYEYVPEDREKLIGILHGLAE